MDDDRMRLADYITAHATRIVDEAELFASTQLGDRVKLDSQTLRDHLPQILEVVVAEMRAAQTPRSERRKAEGGSDTPASSPLSPAQWHGRLRAKSGFTIDLLVAEYRALRASVLRLWAADHGTEATSFDDMMRFNQAVDQAIAESVAHYAAEAETWRNIFLGVLGHDLRGPLTAILLTSAHMARMASDAPMSRLTRRLVMSGERMATLLDDLLDFSRTSLGVGLRVKRGDADLVRELHDEVEMLRMAWPGARIEFAAPGAVTGHFDASRIREAIANLVNNAVKYGASHGDIRVVLGRDADAVVIEVGNLGTTIPDELIATMFDPLRRGNGGGDAIDDGTSLGLGLFVVREVARAHDGEITVASSTEGTVFTMRLPWRAPVGTGD